MTTRNVILALHIFFAILLLGPLVFNAFFIPSLIRRGTEALPMLRFSEKTEAFNGRAAAVVLLLGIWLVLRDSHDLLNFKSTWVSASIGLFVVAAVIGAVGIGGALKKAIAKIEAGETAAAEATRAAVLGGINFVILATIVYLMVAKPGTKA